MNVGSANGGKTIEAEDVGAEARTVFVRNLSYTLTDSQLQEVFSEIGPVRRSFTIKVKGTEQHRGFGYVQFATVDDALRAVKEKDGTVLQGRKVMVKLAKRRASFEQRRTKRQPDKQPNKDGREILDSSGLDEKAPQTPSNVSAKLEKQQETIQAKPNIRGEAAQEKQTSQHGSRTMQETCNSLDAIPGEELKSLSEIKKHEPSEANLLKNGDAVHAKNKRKQRQGFELEGYWYGKKPFLALEFDGKEPSLDCVLLTDEVEPLTYKEAELCDDKKWELAMQSVMQSLYANNTWELVPLPKGRKAIPNKWVYKFSSSFHPQTDGQSEIVNSVVLDLLKSYISDQKTQWKRYLPLVEFAYNNTIHSSTTGKARFEIVEGAMKVPPFFSTKDKIFEADEYTRDLDTAFTKVRETLLKSQERQKKAADRHRRDLKLKENDWVLLRFEKARLRKKKGKERFFSKA
ncbi:hypothetical protein L7F22_042798 [Adiantum nelumboides]|nr:hypothetical protein [Adiantum nelumboides]